jgi:hypothetical protein
MFDVSFTVLDVRNSFVRSIKVQDRRRAPFRASKRARTDVARMRALSYQIYKTASSDAFAILRVAFVRGRMVSEGNDRPH